MKGYGGYWHNANYGANASGQRDSSGPSPPRPAEANPYAVLGLSASANEREIKRAYRQLISRHHPDKLGDVPEDLKRRAEERAREINMAYEKIKSEHGFK